MTAYTPSVTQLFIIIFIGCGILVLIPITIYIVHKVKTLKQKLREGLKERGIIK